MSWSSRKRETSPGDPVTTRVQARPGARMIARGRPYPPRFPTAKTDAAAGRTTSLTVDRALERLSEHGIRFLDLRFVDVLGTVKSITIPAQRLPHAVRNGEWFDGSSVEGFARVFESDMFLRPDLNTLTIGDPDGVLGAQVICDLLTPDGERFAGDPRGVLARALAEAAALGFDYAVATELEFFLLNTDAASGGVRPGRHDRASYFDHPVEAITLRIAGQFHSAYLETPEGAAMDLPLRTEEGQSEVTIPKLLLWGAVSMR